MFVDPLAPMCHGNGESANRRVSINIKKKLRRNLFIILKKNEKVNVFCHPVYTFFNTYSAYTAYQSLSIEAKRIQVFKRPIRFHLPVRFDGSVQFFRGIGLLQDTVYWRQNTTINRILSKTRHCYGNGPRKDKK